MTYVAREMYYIFGNWNAGEPVNHKGRRARVVAVPVSALANFSVDSVSVPIIYDDEAGSFVIVEEAEIVRRSLR